MEIANKDDDLFLRLSDAPIPAAPDCGGPMTEGITGPASTGQSRGSGNPVRPSGTPETPVVWLVCFLGVGAGKEAKYRIMIFLPSIFSTTQVFYNEYALLSE